MTIVFSLKVFKVGSWEYKVVRLELLEKIYPSNVRDSCNLIFNAK